MQAPGKEGRSTLDDNLKPNTPGKGDTPRKTDKEKFDENWDRIFGNEKKEK